MKSTSESIASSMDCEDIDLVNYLPYILQDFKSIGADPGVIVNLVKKNMKNYPSLKVLDLGCGKGTVSTELAKELNSFCHGIDAVEGFIKEAALFATESGVEDNCIFETADIRTKVAELRGYDVILFASTGPLFGDYESSIKGVLPALAKDGIIIMDDWYKNDNDKFEHPRLVTKAEILRQATSAGAELIDEFVHEQSAEVGDGYSQEYENLKKRCLELSEMHPEKREMFMRYVSKQSEEYDVLRNKVICSAMVFKKIIQ